MPRRRLAILILFVCKVLASPLRAADPVVVTDIPPVAGLVAAVMDGVGTPVVLLSGGGSPHGGALRPSEARSLQKADLVIWVGPGLTPWLGPAVAALAPDAAKLSLLKAPVTALLPGREAADFGVGETGQDNGAGHGAGTSGAPVDPHVWLDPENARAWLAPIAAALSQADPEHTALYDANAAAAGGRIAAAAEAARATLAPVRDRPFLVGHDAFQYFEAAFGLKSAGAVTLSDAAKPGPAQIAHLQRVVADAAPVCVFFEPGASVALAATVFDGRPVRQAELDPMGWTVPPGPEHYPALLSQLSRTVADCLS